jgi:S1-C subfamily serine protease
MTNRHVAENCPFWGYGIFHSKEEVAVSPVFSDPIHDYAILQFDPRALKHMTVSALTIKPENAKVGVEVRLVGNDAGHEGSILSGFISKIDNNVPCFTEWWQQDSDTNYIQGSMDAAGGSSGSPIFAVDGSVLAIQAAGDIDSTTDFFLPLGRAKRTLACIQEGRPVTRGTIQIQWFLETFDVCRRLGVTAEREAEHRTQFPGITKMLVAKRVLPGGPSDGKIQVGDVLISVNERLQSYFEDIEHILDSNIGGTISLCVQRHGKDCSAKVMVQDLHKLTPDRYVEVGGATFNKLSYRSARDNNIPCNNQVFLGHPKGFFSALPRGCVFEQIDSKPVQNMDDFIRVVGMLPDDTAFTVSYRTLTDPNLYQSKTVIISRRWSKMKFGVRNDKTGIWDVRDVDNHHIPSTSVSVGPEQVVFEKTHNVPEIAEVVNRAMVFVSFKPVCHLDGETYAPPAAYGFVLNNLHGFVIVAAVTVPHDLGEIYIQFAGTTTLRAKFVVKHPEHGYSIIQYDPACINGQIDSITLSSQPAVAGDSTLFVGRSSNQKERSILVNATTILAVDSLELPRSPYNVKTRVINSERVWITSDIGFRCPSGLLVDSSRLVQAMWLKCITTNNQKQEEYCHLGIPASAILPVVEQLQNDVVPEISVLGVEWEVIELEAARAMKVSDARIQQVTSSKGRHQLLRVKRALTCNNASTSLQIGDIFLSLNKSLITSFHAIQETMKSNVASNACVHRLGSELSMQLLATQARRFETTRVIDFCGAILQAPPYVMHLKMEPASQVWVSNTTAGSPAFQSYLVSGVCITQVDGQPISDLDSLLDIAKRICSDRGKLFFTALPCYLIANLIT